MNHCHSGCEWKRHRYSAYGQIFEWPVDDADVGRDGFVDVDWLVKRGPHIADDHTLVLRMSELCSLLRSASVRFGSLADIAARLSDVRFTSNSGHQNCVGLRSPQKLRQLRNI